MAFKYRQTEKHNQISKYAINKLIKMALNIQNINQINSKLRLNEQNKILQKENSVIDQRANTNKFSPVYKSACVACKTM